MRPREPLDGGRRDLFRARLDQIIDPGHPLVKLAGALDWGFLAGRFGEPYSDKASYPPLPTRLMAGLMVLKQTQNLSVEARCERSVENPSFPFLCSEEFFRHAWPFDRSSLTRWRPAHGPGELGEEKLIALLQESLATAVRTKATKPADFTKVAIDTTVQEKAIAHPTNAKLMHGAHERLVRPAKREGVVLGQSFERIGKRVLIACALATIQRWKFIPSNAD